MFTALYNLIIFPLNELLEFFYEFIYEATYLPPVAIIGLSFVVTLCTLPLYMVAEKWQDKERETQAKLKPGVDRIKKFFKGDEQYMILNTFYRQNHYSPIMALRSSFSLLIQIPFFLAAYHFLSDLGSLNGIPFLFIKDLVLAKFSEAATALAGREIHALLSELHDEPRPQRSLDELKQFKEVKFI